MEEKILIESYHSKRFRKVFMSIIISLLIASLICLILGLMLGKRLYASYYVDKFCFNRSHYDCCFCREVFADSNVMIYHLLENHNNKLYIFEGGLGFFISHWLLLFFAALFYLIYFLLSRCHITVSNKNIIGRAFYGKKLVLPIHMISDFSIRKIFCVVGISTASGYINFPCISNYKEIADILQQLLNERQQKTETKENIILPQNKSKNLDDLVKLKNLLENDIITQDEFEIKKKEILGL